MKIPFYKLATFLLIISFSTLANGAAYIFADIPWESSKAEVTKKLIAKGYVRNTKNSEMNKAGDLLFDGKLAGENAQLFAIFSKNNLVKIVINLKTSDEDAINSYKKMQETLTGKYGPATNDYNYFKEPYFDGDGYEIQAIRHGKGVFFSIWVGEDGSSLGLEITKVLTVKIGYESANWEKEVNKRQQETTSDL